MFDNHHRYLWPEEIDTFRKHLEGGGQAIIAPCPDIIVLGKGDVDYLRAAPHGHGFLAGWPDEKTKRQFGIGEVLLVRKGATYESHGRRPRRPKPSA